MKVKCKYLNVDTTAVEKERITGNMDSTLFYLEEHEAWNNGLSQIIIYG